jgi:hypothetical protein
MKYRNPLNQILSLTRAYWDRDETRPAVRQAFRKADQCRTKELGAEVYASENKELVVPHTCKSRACTSCGHRANRQWLREKWVALPDVSYRGITFTMPDLLWPFFHENPQLAQALPTLAAAVIESQVGIRNGVRVGVVAILHTFNGRLDYNSHVHTMVTAGGLRSSNSWAPRVYYDRSRLMKAWRKAIVALLRAALKVGLLWCEMSASQIGDLLDHVERCWWSINIQLFESKWRFLQYAGRYVRRPPIAQRRITRIGERNVRFWYMDKKLRRRVEIECSLEQFIDRWAQHIPNHYQHSVRNFGLFGSRGFGQTASAIFAILGQKRKPRPKPVRWADSIKRDFGHNPLLDHMGNIMKWTGRLAPKLVR